MYLYILEQNKLQWIKDLRIKNYTLKIPEENISEYFYTWSKKAS